MKHLFILFAVFMAILLQACSGESENKTETQEPTAAEETPRPPKADMNTVSYEEELSGGGMQFSIRTTGEGEQRSLSITVEREGQEPTRIDEAIEGSVSQTYLTDLNRNKKPELLVFVQGGGSGSYGKVYGYEFEREYWGQLTMPALSPDLQKDYMGHDEFKVTNNRLIRTFPIYLDTDPNCCPSGGYHTVTYTLDKALNLLVEKSE